MEGMFSRNIAGRAKRGFENRGQAVAGGQRPPEHFTMGNVGGSLIFANVTLMAPSFFHFSQHWHWQKLGKLKYLHKLL